MQCKETWVVVRNKFSIDISLVIFEKLSQDLQKCHTCHDVIVKSYMKRKRIMFCSKLCYLSI